MTTGVTLYDWAGRPAITRDGEVRYVASPGSVWTGNADDSAVSLASVRAEAASIGRDAFDDRFAGPPWSVPDLAGWYHRPNRALSWRDIRR